jgi:hypothetical protein
MAEPGNYNSIIGQFFLFPFSDLNSPSDGEEMFKHKDLIEASSNRHHHHNFNLPTTNTPISFPV